MQVFYRLHDVDGGGMIATNPAEAKQWNERCFGIFAAVQAFAGTTRRIDHCTRIRAWAIDIDEGTKSEQQARIARSPLSPSSIVETKNGYHVYWYAADGSKELYRPLVSRLVEYFGGDKNARDLARVLRVPGFYHMKNPESPFLVRHVYGPNRARKYYERQMFRTFPPTAEETVVNKNKAVHEETKRQYNGAVSGSGNLFDRIYRMDQMEVLRCLSGSSCVDNQVFTFYRVANGNHNIWVDGESTSCFIDEHGKIGSNKQGGPTIIQWLTYPDYGHSLGEAVRIVKDYFPHLEEEHGW